MKIFISYCHEDSDIMLQIKQALDAHEVWFDHRLSVGQEWWDEIEHNIAACDCFMLMMSPCSIASEYCQKEIDTALRLDKPIASIMIYETELPDKLRRFQVISVVSGITAEATVKVLNGLFEIERQVYNPLKQRKKSEKSPSSKLSITDLYFATTNIRKKRMYEQILNATLQTTPIEIDDIQHVDPTEVALKKAVKAFEALQKPVFVEQSALCVRAWGDFPGGLTTTAFVAIGLSNICRMLQPFEDKYAESVSVIAFTDGQMQRKFIGVVEGEIPPTPRGNGYSWNNIFIPSGFSQTLGEMDENAILSISSRRRAIVKFMQFLQTNYDFS
jgi:XTP/dITP diphosphohydrolase